MDNSRLVNFIENSFLAELIKRKEITDISYNGYLIFYMDNDEGRKQSKIRVSAVDVKDFIRQIANLTEKQFSYQNPVLDITAGRYRVHAMHNSIARYDDEQVTTFSIRISTKKPRITDNNGFLTKELISLINVLIKAKLSITIGGITGSGKTNFQKYLLTKMEENTRIIVIDNVMELSQTSDTALIDMNVWQADEKNMAMSVQLLVKNALRSNPDWLIIAEARGGEMLEILNSVMTGHPVITTLHAQTAEQMPNRIARMVMMNDKRSDYHEVLQDVYENFPVHFYLKRVIQKNGHVKRFIDSVVVISPTGEKTTIYQRKNDEHIYHQIPPNLCALIGPVDDELFIKTFGGGINENL